MSYGSMNIWLRDLECCPKNVWKVELVVKTCSGEYLVDFNPDVVEKLQESYPEYSVTRASREGETTIVLRNRMIKHVELDVPPGCYLVRAWVCSGNLWTDRAMVMVRCGEDACVNLIVPRRHNCIREVIIPLGMEAREHRLPIDGLRPAVEFLAKAGRVAIADVRRDVAELVKELKETEAEAAPRYLDAFGSFEKVVKGIREAKK